jgi:integrase
MSSQGQQLVEIAPKWQSSTALGCAIVPPEANLGRPSKGAFDSMARRRFQRGSVFLRGTREVVWVGRWREDVVGPDGLVKRVSRKEVLGSKCDFPTKKLALRELASRLAPINSVNYRALRTATFTEFSTIWQNNALTQHKPSTQAVVRSQLRKWLVPYFGGHLLKDIGGQTIQMFIQNCHRSPKTCRNFVLTLRMIWNSAKAWGYVTHNPFDGLVLPKVHRQMRFFFTVVEIRRILDAATEPHKTFYWLAAETGMRAGELCGLRIEDMDLENCVVNVKQSVWRGQVQTPKTVNSIRKFAISQKLASYLRSFLTTWRPNPLDLVFATRLGTPWAPSEIMRSKLHPLLDSLGIKRCGLHAFRHTNGSLMDRLNAPMKVRQERLGHALGSDVTMAVYTHSVSEDDRRVALQLGDILCPNVPKLAEREIVEVNENTTIQ